MKLIPFKAACPNLDIIASADSFFSTVKTQYLDYMKSGFFRRSKEEAIYIYELQTVFSTHKGIIACTDINDFIKGRVLKHEHTLAPKEQQMMNLLLQNQAMVKPVLLAYDAVEEIDVLINEVIEKGDLFFEVNFSETIEKHRIWKIENNPISEKIRRLFKSKVGQCYLADGHHRVQTAILLHQTNSMNEVMDTKLKSILSLYFSWKELKIYEFNRCVDVFQTISPLRFLVELSQYCKMKRIKSGRKPKRKHEITMVLYGEWYSLTWKKSILKKHQAEDILFDTFLLNEYVLKKIVGIQEVRDDMLVRYVEGISGIFGLEQMVSRNENRVGFCMFPIDSEELKTVADQGLTLPPKSTWFEPRVKNGLLVKEF